MVKDGTVLCSQTFTYNMVFSSFFFHIFVKKLYSEIYASFLSVLLHNIYSKFDAWLFVYMQK